MASGQQNLGTACETYQTPRSQDGILLLLTFLMSSITDEVEVNALFTSTQTGSTTRTDPASILCKSSETNKLTSLTANAGEVRHERPAHYACQKHVYDADPI